MGKTWASWQLIQQPGQLVLIHDDSKAEREFPPDGSGDPAVPYYASIDAVMAVPLEQAQGQPIIGFRGDVYAGQVCEVEQVAALAMKLARAHVPVRLVVDETERAMSEGGRKLEAPSLREAFVMGRTMGTSVIWSTQTPQRAPEVALNQSSTIGIFRLEAPALNYLDDRLNFNPEMLFRVPDLQEGEFVLHRSGHPWDRTVYRF
jgi:hypothetical protein